MNQLPFAIVVRQTKQEIIDVLNKSGLPFDAMDMMLGEIKFVVHEQAEYEYAEAMKQIEKDKEGENGEAS